MVGLKVTLRIGWSVGVLGEVMMVWAGGCRTVFIHWDRVMRVSGGLGGLSGGMAEGRWVFLGSLM